MLLYAALELQFSLFFSCQFILSVSRIRSYKTQITKVVYNIKEKGQKFSYVLIHCVLDMLGVECRGKNITMEKE